MSEEQNTAPQNSEDQNLPTGRQDFELDSVNGNQQRESIEQSSINNPAQTENMEVQHPHHVTHKKKWTEYLLEFFMLFFAVFLGFVAENIREDKVEKSRAIKFAKNLLNDLSKDTAEFSVAIIQQQTNGKGIDTIIHILRQPDHLLHLHDVLSRFRYITNNYILTRYDATSQQLTYTGSLRLFENIRLYNDLTSYYSQLRKFNETMNSLGTFRMPILDAMAEMVDYRSGIDTSVHMNSIAAATKWMPDYGLGLNKFILNIAVVQKIYMAQVVQISKLKQQAVEIMKEIKEE